MSPVDAVAIVTKDVPDTTTHARQLRTGEHTEFRSMK